METLEYDQVRSGLGHDRGDRLLTVSYKGIDATGKIEIRSSGFSVPSDDISMHHIEGTPSGRIFMGGRDGNLYELHYQRGQGLMQVIGLHRNCWITSHTRYLLPEIVPRSIRSKLSSVGESTCLTFDRDRQIVYLLVEEDRALRCAVQFVARSREV